MSAEEIRELQKIEAKVDNLAKQLERVKDGNGNGEKRLAKYIATYLPLILVFLAAAAAWYDLKHESANTTRDLERLAEAAGRHWSDDFPHRGSVLVRESLVRLETNILSLKDGQEQLRKKIDDLEKKISP